MNTITHDWLVEASRWLFDYFLLATVLLAVVLVLGKFLAQPARRMAVHWSTAAGLLLLALLCAVPGWSVVNLLSAPSPVFHEAALDAALDKAPKQLPPYPTVLPPVSDAVAIAMQTHTVLAPTKVVETVAIDYGLLISCVVAAGSTLFAVWLALGHWQMRRLRSQAKTAPAELEALLPQLIAAGQRTPTLGIVAKLPVAAAVGLRRPMVLLPQSFLELADPEKLQSVLAHELAHIRHRDLWLLALLRGLLLVLWPHPLYWLWRRSVRLDQETLADAAAADVTTRTDYAEQLVAWARETASEVRRRPLASSVGLWESPSQLKRRIAILLDEKLTVLRACSRRWRVGSAMGMLAIAGGLSLITLSPAEPKVALAESNEPTKTNEARPTQESKLGDTLPTVDGRILDLQGKPIANAEVGLALDVDDVERYVAKYSFEATATTDQNGMFSIPFDPALRESLGTIWAYAPGYLPNRVLDIPIIAAFERENTVIRLRKAKQTQFQLLDDQRQPISGASVKVESVKLPESVAYRIPANWASQFETTTDDRGMATIRSAIPNSISQVRVHSQISGVVLFDSDFFLNTQAANKLPHYSLPIPTGGRISGRITASETAAPRSVQLELWTEVTPAFGPRSGVFGSATAVADNQGHFEVPVLAAGILVIESQLEYQQPWRLDVSHRKEVVAGKATQLDIPIVRAVRIQGLVRKQNTGEGYPNFRLEIGNRKSGQGVKVKTDAKGQFEAFVLPGTVELRMTSAPRDYRAADLIMKLEVPANVHVFELEPIDLVPTKNITGRLVDKNQQPLEGWDVDGFPERDVMNSFNSWTRD